MDKIDRLYDICSVLIGSGDKVAEHEAEYLQIINGANGSANEKGFTCKFMPKFLKYFPHLAQTALDAQLDLLQDEDATVRELAVKYLPVFCKNSNRFVPIITDTLTIMLIMKNSYKLETIQASLMAVMQLDLQGSLHSILDLIFTSEQAAVRKEAIEFLRSKLKVLPEEIFTKEIEEFFLYTCKKKLPQLSLEDFLNVLSLLLHLKSAKTVPVQNAIAEIMSSKLDVVTNFNISLDNIISIICFLKQECNIFSRFVSPKRFASYICLKIFPILGNVKNLENGMILILDTYKVLAEISAYFEDDDYLKGCAIIVLFELLKYLPPPPPPESAGENEFANPKLYFTHIECLLYTFVQFLKQNDEIIMSVDYAAHLKDLKLRLQFLSKVISRALKRVKDSEKSLVKSLNEESKLKAIAEPTMININLLIRDFFRSPVSFESAISLSWKPADHRSSHAGVKRHYEASASSAKLPRQEKRACRNLYVPPSGKYSSCLSFPPNSSNRF